MLLWRGCGRSAAVAAVALAGLLVGVAPAAAITPIDLQTTFSQRFDGGPFAAAGDSVDNAGLVNGDSVPDMIVGDANGRGEADIVYGDASANGQVVSPDALAGLGYRLRGTGLPSAFANAGLSVADAGDVNGDGIPDQIVGTPALPNCVDAPNAYVVFGRRGAGATDLDLANIGTPGNTNGYRITGTAAPPCHLDA